VDDTNYHAYDQNFKVVTLNHDDSVNAKELGVNYQIDSAWRVFARTADGFRFATTNENNLVLPGVKFLDPQTSQSQEAGVAWSEQSARVQYSLYHMKIDDELMYDSFIANANSYNGHGANINLPSSERQGFMFDGDVQLSEQFELRGNYTYTDASLSSGSFDGKDVPYVAKNTANVGVVFNFVKRVSAVVDMDYIGSRYRVGDYANTAEKVNALTLFNFNILWDIKDIELGFRVKNITGEKYADYNIISSSGGLYEYPQPGRTYSAHISYRF